MSLESILVIYSLTAIASSFTIVLLVLWSIT